MPIAKEQSRKPTLVTERIPQRVADITDTNKAKDSMGDMGFRDAITVIAIAWALVFLLGFSLHSHNV